MADRNKILLDVDPTLLENNLLLKDAPDDDDLDSFISTLKSKGATNTPWKLVKPNPGFVVKTRSESGEKIFLNICHTEDIPPPRDLSDAELIKILESEEPSSYRLPMSIGDLHQESDKSGAPCLVYDIAINTTFFHKVETNQLFRSFLLTVVLGGVGDKYKKEIDTNDYVILKNRKVMGSLQHHRIEQRAVATTPRKLLIEEVKTEFTKDKPRFRIIREPPVGIPEVLTVQVHIKDASSGKKLLLDVGEDRLVLRSAKSGSLLDIFLPYSVDQDGTCAHFDITNQVLSVELPVISVGT
ncbi:PIH1 domain-containing protein 1-like [Macrosteles quadrilineatus]|uniref:PIH1 domain-containing protein 1-like n=1 Tax=Macrosteles quadrilineatus TaxID=74068 RepID=UPI0023E177F7|nr:PIH1 domain-containing protein 1-like [Macrosteles quadrilineatus]XP_054263846.1 PIH1 domain-containing protein 1-like [Macrosteles quadrilineatus]